MKLLYGFAAIFAVALIGNIASGSFNLGFQSQPVAHSAHLWNFVGMVIVGWGSVLLGGCPLRQLVLAGEGNADSAITVLGMISGGAAAHAMKTASSGTGIGENGALATIICLVVLALVSVTHLKKEG
jgi:YedE family putative selenium metabolism protein